MKGKCSQGARPQLFWKTVWSLRIPNSAKMFLRQACNRILPTKDNLKKRRVLTNDICIFCCRAVETTHHILWDYPSSQDVWCVNGSRIQKRRFEGDDFSELVENLIEFLHKDEIKLFAMIAKRIWKRRNGVVYGETFIHPCTVVR